MEAAKVKDFMVPLDQYVCISEEATIYDAFVALEKVHDRFEAQGYPHRAVLVCDSAGRVIGKLSHLALLKSLEPRYAELGDLKKLSGFGLSAEFLKSTIDRYDLWQASLDELCQRAVNVKLGDIVAYPTEGEVIDQNASLCRGIHQLIMGRYQSLLVTSKGDIIGVLKLTDVFLEAYRRLKEHRI